MTAGSRRTHTYVAGAKLEDGQASDLRRPGRWAPPPCADSLADAMRDAYASRRNGVQFENAYRRRDIGQRALQA